MRYGIVPILLALLTISTLSPVSSRAADPAGQGAPLHGSNVMDGKDKPGQDGWSWAPTPRDQAASKSAKTPGESETFPPGQGGPAPKGEAHLPPGQDPGTPVPSGTTRPGQAAAGGG